MVFRCMDTILASYTPLCFLLPINTSNGRDTPPTTTNGRDTPPTTEIVMVMFIFDSKCVLTTRTLSLVHFHWYSKGSKYSWNQFFYPFVWIGNKLILHFNCIDPTYWVFTTAKVFNGIRGLGNALKVSEWCEISIYYKTQVLVSVD